MAGTPKRMAARSVVSFPTLEQIKTALGIDAGDASKDAAITALLASTIAIIEGYLGRGIALEQVIEEFDPPETRVDVLLLHRFPVQQVVSITHEGGAEITGARVYKATGVVRWRHGCARVRGCGCEDLAPILVEYSGGYAEDAWPADLLDAVMRAFYGRWQATGGTGNTADMVGGPGNRSVTIDGLTITRDAASFAGSALADQAVPPELASVAAQLEPYRVIRAGGV